MTKRLEKAQARQLRAEGLSIKSIAKSIGVSPGSILRWVNDIELSAEQKERLAKLPGAASREANNRKARERRVAYCEAGKRKAATDMTFRFVAALYWGEGTKNGNKFSVANSDPAMIRFVLQWLIDEGWGERVQFSVIYHGYDSSREEEIKNWWKISIPELRNEMFRKFNRKQATHNNAEGRMPFGCGYIGVNSTELACKVLGGIEWVKLTGIAGMKKAEGLVSGVLS